MKKYHLSFVFLCSLIFPLAVFGTPVSKNANPAASLETTLMNIKTIQADFSEVILTGSHVNQRLSGVFYLKKMGAKDKGAGKFLWKTIKPIHQEIISNGKQVWIYDKDLEQVTITSLQKNVGATPVLLLNGEKGNIAQNYKVNLAQKSSGSRIDLYTLVPKHKTLYRFIQMSFDGKILTHMRFEDNLGQFTDFTFTHIKLNQPILDKLFVFVPPKNVDIIHE